MAIDPLAPIDVNGIFHASADHGHMVSAGGQQRVSGENTVSILRLLHSNLAEGVEALGKLACEGFRHVLHDYDAREVGGKW